MQKIKVGIVGCGNISSIYLQNLSTAFNNIELVACADIVFERAQKKVGEKDENGKLKFGGVRAMTVADVLAIEDIEIIVNLTNPHAHFNVAMDALDAGKNVYNEKPLVLSLEEGHKLLAFAEERDLLVGCAPDTFMGAGIQTCRKLIEDGWIGKPTSATAFMCCSGHESWHPNPAFYYLNGGGPMFDMGPYYLTALVNLLGPVETVVGMNGMASKERVCTSKECNGVVLPVEVPTHVTGLLRFTCGAIATLITSFDVSGHHLPCIEIHGTLGSLQVPDPNDFGGKVSYCRRGSSEWKEVPLTHSYSVNSRGIGVADMAKSLNGSGDHHANGRLGLHVLEIMHSIHKSFEKRAFLDIVSEVSKPKELGMGSFLF